MTLAGFPHSEIDGSTLTSSSPSLIAGSHVLHRLLVPRHPPCALCSLTSCLGISTQHVSAFSLMVWSRPRFYSIPRLFRIHSHSMHTQLVCSLVNLLRLFDFQKSDWMKPKSRIALSCQSVTKWRIPGSNR